eukprot:1403867-Alexandrium_andersonii.AAC.1
MPLGDPTPAAARASPGAKSNASQEGGPIRKAAWNNVWALNRFGQSLAHLADLPPPGCPEARLRKAATCSAVS